MRHCQAPRWLSPKSSLTQSLCTTARFPKSPRVPNRTAVMMCIILVPSTSATVVLVKKNKMPVSIHFVVERKRHFRPAGLGWLVAPQLPAVVRFQTSSQTAVQGRLLVAKGEPAPVLHCRTRSVPFHMHLCPRRPPCRQFIQPASQAVAAHAGRVLRLLVRQLPRAESHFALLYSSIKTIQVQRGTAHRPRR